MYIKKIGSKKAVIILHEIYGINQYIEDWATYFNTLDYDAYCLDLLHKEKGFSYLQQQEAYNYFRANIGFDAYKEVELFLEQLYEEYSNVVVFGSSIGATIAWLLTNNKCCNRMIGYYGSRIRDYININPSCPCLLLFAKDEKSFCVRELQTILNSKLGVMAEVLEGEHGFADRYTAHNHVESSKKALEMVELFLNDLK
jgi:dienelactone hydrolase